jgi:hypothetical protein
MNPFI